MKTQLQVTLLAAAALYLGWGLALLLAPQATYPLISGGSYDKVVTALFGVTLLGFMVACVIAAFDPEKEIVRAAAAGMALLGFVAAYFLFLDKSMPLGPLTVGSVFAVLAASGVLFLLQARLDLQKQVSGLQH